MAFIEAEKLCFSYKNHNAFNNLSVSIEKGTFVAICGSNGSGKSTFAKMLDALLPVQSGSLFINGFDASKPENVIEIRKTVGLVFQNPENQIIGDTVEEDVAFGPENMGLDSVEIERRVANALRITGLEDLRNKSTANLSGGQKQLVAIAGILAMESECIVLDEALSMLDAESRKKVIGVLKKLNGEGITILMITHRNEEAELCNRVIDFSEVQHA